MCVCVCVCLCVCLCVVPGAAGDGRECVRADAEVVCANHRGGERARACVCPAKAGVHPCQLRHSVGDPQHVRGRLLVSLRSWMS